MIKQLPINQNGRDFVIGDLHGCYDLLMDGLEELNFNMLNDRCISVGDIIDRGPKNVECLQLLNEPWFHSVRGNHEQLMQDYFLCRPDGEYWNRRNGAGWFHTLNDDDKRHVRSFLPKLEKLPWLITVDMANGNKFHVIHAELESNLGEQIFDSDLEKEYLFKKFATKIGYNGFSCIWGRTLWGSLFNRNITNELGDIRTDLILDPPFFNEDLSHIFSGHTPVHQVTTIQGQTNLDTFACQATENLHSGLTITEPLTNRFWLVRPDEIKEVKALVI